MAEAKELRKVVGVTIQLTTAEAIALVNTAERVGQIIDVNDGKPGVTGAGVASIAYGADWEALCGQFLDGQGREEAETFFTISRAVGPLIKYTSDSSDE